MDANIEQAQAAAWVVAEEEDWPGVNDCGAIFVPDREMRFEVDEDEWAIEDGC